MQPLLAAYMTPKVIGNEEAKRGANKEIESSFRLLVSRSLYLESMDKNKKSKHRSETKVTLLPQPRASLRPQIVLRDREEKRLRNPSSE